MSFRRSRPMVLSFIAVWTLPIMHPSGAVVLLYAQVPPPALTVERGAGGAALSLGNNPPFHTTLREVQNERLIDVPGSPVCAALWDELEADGSVIPFYGISLDGATMKRVRQTSYELKLRHGRFDPGVAARPVAASLRAPPTSEVYIVQFITQPLEAYRSVLRDLGATIYKFLPSHAYLVRMIPAVKAQVQALDFVRWVGPFHPAYKLGEELRADLLAEFSSEDTQRYSIMVHRPGDGRMSYVRDEIEAVGGIVHMISPQTKLMDATLTLDQLRFIVALDEVMFVGVRGEPVTTMNVAREISGANYLETVPVPGFKGEGVRGEVLDAGLLVTHDAFDHPTSSYPIIHCGNSTNPINTDHGTQVYGTVFGDGTWTPVTGAKGILPEGEGIFSSFIAMLVTNPCTRLGSTFPLCSQTRFHHTAQLVGSSCCPDPAGDCPYNAVFQTNSWGSGLSPNYVLQSAELDDILFTLDLLMCNGQGNEGATGTPQKSVQEAWAKNIVSVGGINHFDIECRDDDTWCAGSPVCPPSNPVCTQSPDLVCPSGCASTGPAMDGRVKPDLVHFYDNILTTCDDADDCYTDGSPVPFSGTSAATPITCGYFGLIFQMWHEGVFCKSGGGATVFDSRPHMTTAKALGINTAYQYPIGSVQQNDITRYNQGWGMIDVKNLYDLRDNLFIIDEKHLLTNLQDKSYTVKVDAGSPALKATLVYADPPGVPLSDVNAVNNLTLKVCAPSSPVCTGTVYWGNCGLLEENWSSTGCSADHPYPNDPGNEIIDTVENVFIQNPAAGDWTIEVWADAIAEDGHVKYLNDDPTECCAFIPDPQPPQEPWDMCEEPDAQPGCIVASPVDVDFALVVSGVSNKRACCQQPFGDCADMTRVRCERFGGVFHCNEWCNTPGSPPSTLCEATQGPQQGP